jgi:hypothetical protein
VQLRLLPALQTQQEQLQEQRRGPLAQLVLLPLVPAQYEGNTQPRRLSWPAQGALAHPKC